MSFGIIATKDKFGLPVHKLSSEFLNEYPIRFAWLKTLSPSSKFFVSHSRLILIINFLLTLLNFLRFNYWVLNNFE